ncbi:MAG: copper-binding protein [Sulfuricurvum sp.]|nr:copper-binding protein [Sulfuricurvum sp.]
MQEKILFSLCFAILACYSSVSAMGDEYHNDEKNTVITEKAIAASGTVKFIAEDHASVRIFHDPIPSLKWPAMNMPFDVVDHELTHPLEIGDRVDFEFVQKEGKNIIVRMRKP